MVFLIVQRVDMRDNQLKVAGLQSLLSGLAQNESMTQLDLDQNPAYLVSKKPLGININLAVIF